MTSDYQFTIGLYAVPKIPLIQAGDDIARILYECARDDGFAFHDRDIVVVTHKIVSKAENACVKLAEIEPSDLAQALAAKTGRDPRLCQVYINESKELLDIKGRHVITRHRLGFVGTGAGVDSSNTGTPEEEKVCLIPRDPDASARKIRSALKALTRKELAVIICDTYGNEFRNHSISFAIGIAGIDPKATTNTVDLYGRPQQTATAQVDEIAAAAGMLMGQANESLPVVIVRGIKYMTRENASTKDILIN